MCFVHHCSIGKWYIEFNREAAISASVFVGKFFVAEKEMEVGLYTHTVLNRQVRTRYVGLR